jgi:hypothetical protein
MRDRDFLDSLEWFCSIRNVIYPVKDICTVISGSAAIAHANHNILKNDESVLVLECLALNSLGAHGPFAVFAMITGHARSIMAKAPNEKPVETGCGTNGSRCPSRKTAGLITLRGSRVNAAEGTGESGTEPLAVASGP